MAGPDASRARQSSLEKVVSSLRNSLQRHRSSTVQTTLSETPSAFSAKEYDVDDLQDDLFEPLDELLHMHRGTDVRQASFIGNRQPIQMRHSDEDLMDIGKSAAAAIPWSSLNDDLLAKGSAWKRKRGRENFAVYTKDDKDAGKYAVVAVSEMPCSLDELHEIMTASSSSGFTEIMTSLWGKQFKYGDVIHEVIEEPSDPFEWHRQTQSSMRSSILSDSSRSETRLTVKQLVFKRPNVFSQNEEWFFLDILEGLDESAAAVQIGRRKHKRKFTQTVVSLRPEDLFASARRNDQRAQQDGRLLAGYSFEEEPGGKLTRVRIYAEGSLENAQKKKSKLLHRLLGNRNYNTCSASHRAIRNRLLGFALTTTPLLRLVRRRQLGLQSYADEIESRPTESDFSMAPASQLGDSRRSVDISFESYRRSADWASIRYPQPSLPRPSSSRARPRSATSERKSETARPSFDLMLTDLRGDTFKSTPVVAKNRSSSFMKVTKTMGGTQAALKRRRSMGSMSEGSAPTMLTITEHSPLSMRWMGRQNDYEGPTSP